MPSVLSRLTHLPRWALAVCACALTVLCHAASDDRLPPIHVNQLGFAAESPKIAVVPAAAGADFWLVDASSNKEVLRGPLTTARTWDMAEQSVRLADFSAFEKPGRYFVRAEGAADSPAFRIGDGVLDEALKASVKAYYFNRTGAGLEERHAGEFARPPAHPDTIVYIHEAAASEQRPAGTVVSAPKGWYDAGDYNKYVVNSGITMFTLLRALQDFESTFATMELNIPESGNRLPDLLDEILWNMDWLELMQDPDDGGVYHKLTEQRFSAAVMPHLLNAPRYMMPKTTAATLDFAAMMAMAARVLQPYAPHLSGRLERYRNASARAWQWAEKNPEVLYQQPEDVNTGTYARPGEDLQDEWLWAASEMYALTGKRAFLKRATLPQSASVPEWADVGTLGLYTLAEADRVPSKIKAEARRLVIAAADTMVDEWRASAYQVPMVKRDFVWGSNAVAMNKAMVLLMADRLASKADYRSAAQGLLDYLVGRNPTGYSYLTGYGSNTLKDTHHRVSYADDVEEPVPGFLAGGPHPGWQDECEYPSRAPARSFLDDWCSYSTNEVAINWNAPLIYVLAAFR